MTCCHRDASGKALMIDVFSTYANIAIALWKKSQNCPLAVTFRHHRAFCWSRSLSDVEIERGSLLSLPAEFVSVVRRCP
jgi:hypothetical protein